MLTNEETARGIVRAVLAEEAISTSEFTLSRLARRITDSLAEVELIAEDIVTENTLGFAVAAYHGLTQEEAAELIRDAYFRVNGTFCVQPEFEVCPGTVVESLHGTYYSSFVI